MLLDRESSSVQPRPSTDRSRPYIGNAPASDATASPAAVVHSRQRSLDLLLDGRGSRLSGNNGEQKPLLPRPASTPRSLAALPADRAATSMAHGSEWTQQLNSYASWVNAQLQRRWPGRAEVTDLRRELRDGTVLVDLLQALSGEPIAAPHAAPATAHDMSSNVDHVLQFMRSRNIKMQPITADEVVAGSTRSVMRLILALAAHFKPGSARQTRAAIQPPQAAHASPQQQQQQDSHQQSWRFENGTAVASAGSVSARQSSSLIVAREMVAALARIRQDMAKVGRPAADALRPPVLGASAAAGAPVLGQSLLQPKPIPRGRATPSPPITWLPGYTGAAAMAGRRQGQRTPASAFADCDDLSVLSGGEGSTTSGGGGSGSCGALSGQSSLEDSQSEGGDEPAAATAAVASSSAGMAKVAERFDDRPWKQLRDTLAPEDGSASAADEVAATRKALLCLQQLLLDGCDQKQHAQQQQQVQGHEQERRHSENAMTICKAEADQSNSLSVTLLSSRLQQATAMCDDLREQLSLSKQECMQLRSAHSNLLRRLNELEEKEDELEEAAATTTAAGQLPATGRLLCNDAATAAAGPASCCCRCSTSSAAAAAAAARELDAVRQLAEVKERLTSRDQLIALLRSEVQRRTTSEVLLAATTSANKRSSTGSAAAASAACNETAGLLAADEPESDLDEQAYDYDEDDETGSESSDMAGDDDEAGESASRVPPVALPLPPPPQKPTLLVDGRHGGQPLASELRAIRRTLQLIRKDYDGDARGMQMVDALEHSIADVLQSSAAVPSAAHGGPSSAVPIGGTAGDGSSHSGEGYAERRLSSPDKKRSVTFLLDGPTPSGDAYQRETIGSGADAGTGSN